MNQQTQDRPKSYSVNLDPQQLEAVQTESLRALVLAGAGSGKTRVLVERIAYLIEEKKVSPYECLAITFTRKAASEMRERLTERLGPQAHNITIGTIHSVALRFLHRFGDLIGYRARSITVYSEWEEQFLLKEVARDLGIYKNGTWTPRKKIIDNVFLSWYAYGSVPEEGKELELLQAFNARCRENNAITFGALQVKFFHLLPKIAQYLKFRHVLVDETQDNDYRQWQIINAICELTGASLFAVGDIDQSIYRFRGAVPEYLVKTQDEFDVYRLENNYRSLPEIVEAANNLIKHNTERLPKTMRATR